MAGKDPRELRERFRQILAQTLLCICDPHEQFLDVGDGHPRVPVAYAFRPASRLAQLPGNAGYSIKVIHNYRVAPTGVADSTFRLSSIGYDYQLCDANEQRIFAYHWHPVGGEGLKDPHLHLYAGAHVGNADVRSAHFLTGRIALEDFVRLLLSRRPFGFAMQAQRPGWDTILRDNQLQFERTRTWSGLSPLSIIP